VRPWHSCPEKLWCPIPGGTQGQVGCGPGQPDPVGGSPAHNRGLALGGLEGPFQPKPFCNSVIIFFSRISAFCWASLHRGHAAGDLQASGKTLQESQKDFWATAVCSLSFLGLLPCPWQRTGKHGLLKETVVWEKSLDNKTSLNCVS